MFGKYNFMKSLNIKLYRVVNNKMRYYSLKVYATLFSTYILEREFGSVQNISATGVKKDYFSNLSDLLKAIEMIKKVKLNKGYQ